LREPFSPAAGADGNDSIARAKQLTIMRTAFLIRRVLVLLAVCSVPALTSFAQQQKSDDVIRVTTDLVQTDFTVFDKQGNFVDGLKRDQLALKVEGKPREISFFDRITAGSRNEEAQLAAARGSTVSGGSAPVPLDRGRMVMFFVDDLHLSPGSVTYVRRMLKQFIESGMKQNDQAQIISASGQLGFMQQLTGNKEVLNTAADRLRTNQMTLETAEYPPITEYQAINIERHDEELIRFFAIAVLKQQGQDNPSEDAIKRASEQIMSRAAQIIEETQSINTRTISNLRGFIGLTSALPGRKVVFFISDGFFLEQRRGDNFDKLQRITHAAAQNGVVIYSLDARGLGSGLPNASQAVMADSSGTLARVNMGEVRASQDAMNALANDTGGRAFFNTNAMTNAVSTALKETSTYYLLAWRPETDEQRNPKFRRLEVNVVGRPDLIVRFRRGIGEPPEETAKSKPKAGDSQPTRKSPTDEIKNLLQAEYPTSKMPVAIALNFLDTAQYGGTLTTSVKVDTHALAIEKQADGTVAALDVAGLVLDDQGKSVSGFTRRFTVKGSSGNNDSKPPDNIFYNHFALVKPGLYQVRVAALDERNGTRGSAYEWIEVPNVANKELALSSLIVGERRSDNQPQQLDGTPNDPHQPDALKAVTVNVDHRFASSSYLRFLTFIYNATFGAAGSNGANTNNATAPNGAASDLAIQVQIFRDDQPVVTTPLHKIDSEGIADARRVPYAAEVALNDLSPGAYVLQVTVIDKLAKASATRKLSFQIE
jgi:VWFA-related protein